MRARGWAIAAAVLAVAGCKTSTRSGDRVAAEPAPGTAPEARAGGDGSGSVAAEGQGGTQQGGVAAGETAAAGAGAPEQANQVTGRVALVDKQQHELAIDAGTATTQVKVAQNAKITVDGKSASFDDIRQGAEVRATMDRSGDTPQATEIAITHSSQPSQKK
ncbi:hypothetical protein [Anaeromyxobacter oryzae]|uniref:DUF5666 domain-containing protein n=1 Tax=Anaeromyxobacter oryzae TaxID=2918170 RepID=A0ABM7X0P7_9BACT|nr:hypothetical protein [Anaeromyxobacter oryzae]BDG05305.1 hypothetical protein AMOR_43010 [Anaeromyxobacter oryzae]